MQPAIAELIAEPRLPAVGQHIDGEKIFERMSRDGPPRYAGLAQAQRSLSLRFASAGSDAAHTADESPPSRDRRAPPWRVRHAY